MRVLHRCASSTNTIECTCHSLFSHSCMFLYHSKESTTFSSILCYTDIFTYRVQSCVQYKIDTLYSTIATIYNVITPSVLYAIHNFVTPSLKFILISEVEKSKSTEVHSPNVLKCDITDSTTEMLWCKDDIDLAPKPGLNFQKDGNMRKLTVQSAELSDTGNNTYHAPGDTVSFKVDVQGDFHNSIKMIICCALFHGTLDSFHF